MNNHVDNPFKSPAVISFCPGILGIERGLKRAGVHPRVVAYVEIEAFIIANLVAGMEAGILDPTPIWTDAKTFDARPFRGRVHGIIGGYPCKPFSVIGKQNGEEHEQHIWPNIYAAADIIRPLFCFFENVVNHLHIGYATVKADLEGLGYTVKEGIYSAEEIGAPHRRERLFILALAHPEKFAQRKQADKTNSITAGREAWNELICGSSIVGNAIGQGLQGFTGNGSRKEGWQKPTGSISKASFPLGQGYEQHSWEAPRVESGLGSTIDGYNFREDLLRALGNSVVEQTAELAFIDLLKKHLKNV